MTKSRRGTAGKHGQGGAPGGDSGPIETLRGADPRETFRRAVERRYQCTATCREVQRIVEQFDGHVLWQGTVYVFELLGHPRATVAYAWSAGGASGSRRRFAALGIPPIGSAMDAVRAAGPDDER